MDTMTISCPHCGQQLQANETFVGKEVSCSTCKRTFLVPPMASVVTPGSDYQDSGLVTYAGFWKRFAALFIDTIVLTMAGAIAGGMTGAILGGAMGAAGSSMQTIQAVCAAAGYMVGTVLNWLYYTLSESSSKQATLGKMALGIKVTDTTGQRLSFAKSNGRYWGKFISAIIFLIGFIMAAFTQKKQALHDIMAGCLVVNK